MPISAARRSRGRARRVEVVASMASRRLWGARRRGRGVAAAEEGAGARARVRR